MAMIAMTTSSSIKVKPRRSRQIHEAVRLEVVITAHCLVVSGFRPKLILDCRTSTRFLRQPTNETWAPKPAPFVRFCREDNRGNAVEKCAFRRTPHLIRARFRVGQ